jgi:hypothetical protein
MIISQLFYISHFLYTPDSHSVSIFLIKNKISQLNKLWEFWVVLAVFPESHDINKKLDIKNYVHIDRKWVADIVYTLEKNNFLNFINAAMKKRKDKLE